MTGECSRLCRPPCCSPVGEISHSTSCEERVISQTRRNCPLQCGGLCRRASLCSERVSCCAPAGACGEQPRAGPEGVTARPGRLYAGGRGTRPRRPPRARRSDRWLSSITPNGPVTASWRCRRLWAQLRSERSSTRPSSSHTPRTERRSLRPLGYPLDSCLHFATHYRGICQSIQRCSSLGFQWGSLVWSSRSHSPPYSPLLQ